MHSEFYQIDETAAGIINETKRRGGRIICVGTTSCRTIESAVKSLQAKKQQEGGTPSEGVAVQAGSGWTDIFIYPGYQFQVLDGLGSSFLAWPLLMNPAVPFSAAMEEQLGNVWRITVLESWAGSSFRRFTAGDWLWISLMAQLLFAVFCLHTAIRQVNPRRKRRWRY